MVMLYKILVITLLKLNIGISVGCHHDAWCLCFAFDMCNNGFSNRLAPAHRLSNECGPGTASGTASGANAETNRTVYNWVQLLCSSHLGGPAASRLPVNCT